LALGGCDALQTPDPISPDPGLEALADAPEDAPRDLDDADDADDADADVAPDADEPPLFECEPSCLDGQFCGPNSVCYAVVGACESVGQVCDPRAALGTEAFVCEPMYDGRVGYCRRRCLRGAQDTGCEADELCMPRAWGNTDGVCRRRCADDAACGRLDVCDLSVSVCKGRCLPWVGESCGNAAGCAALTEEQGRCEPVGTAAAADTCSDNNEDPAVRCQEGLTCSPTDAGRRCLPSCPLDGGGPGACEEGARCVDMGTAPIGACLQACDLLDGTQQCEGDRLGCTVEPAQGPDGLCYFRGRSAQGAECRSTNACAGDLQCLGEPARCLALCDVAAQPDTLGACDAPEVCVPLPDSATLGACEAP
jgi:hypothetical protein